MLSGITVTCVPELGASTNQYLTVEYAGAGLLQHLA